MLEFNSYSRDAERMQLPTDTVECSITFICVNFPLSLCNSYTWPCVLANADCTLQYTVACHPLQIHEVPTIAAMVENLFLQILRRNYSGNTTLNAPSSLHVSSHPLPYEANSNGFAYVVVLMTAMGLMFIPSIFCAQVFFLLPTSSSKCQAVICTAFLIPWLLVFLQSYPSGW